MGHREASWCRRTRGGVDIQAIAWVVGMAASATVGSYPVHLLSGRGIWPAGFLPSVASSEPRPVGTSAPVMAEMQLQQETLWWVHT